MIFIFSICYSPQFSWQYLLVTVITLNSVPVLQRKIQKLFYESSRLD